MRTAISTTPRLREQGFSLIEILVVLVILGLLIGVVAPNVLNQADKARTKTVFADFAGIQSALKVYRLDNYNYPSSEQGLQALVEKPGIDPIPPQWQKGGYLPKLPLDPWNRPYLYIVPGEKGDYDLYSLGADGVSGGVDQNADLYHWQQGQAPAQ